MSPDLVNVNIVNGLGTTITQVKKVIVHESTSNNIIQNGNEKMSSTNYCYLIHNESKDGKRASGHQRLHI